MLISPELDFPFFIPGEATCLRRAILDSGSCLAPQPHTTPCCQLQLWAQMGSSPKGQPRLIWAGLVRRAGGWLQSSSAHSCCCGSMDLVNQSSSSACHGSLLEAHAAHGGSIDSDSSLSSTSEDLVELRLGPSRKVPGFAAMSYVQQIPKNPQGQPGSKLDLPSRHLPGTCWNWKQGGSEVLSLRTGQRASQPLLIQAKANKV